ncbi:MAG: carboxypeptidase regulatory-like domain-containing protein [Candidatus Hydrogenedentes bacterium]|nr:carboxypeptidase regulatory-like domain-containing protein [Candidatus Hydrogenedentota bacterium]
MTSRKALFLLLAVAIVGGVVWLAVAGRGRSGPDASRAPVSVEPAAHDVEGAAGDSVAQPEAARDASEPSGGEGVVEVYGTVSDATTGAPISGASLQPTNVGVPRRRGDDDREEFGGPVVITDADGAFSLPMSPERFGTVTCHAPGHVAGHEPLPKSPGARVRIDFLLLPGASVSGVVRDRVSGEPIENAFVCLGDARMNLVERFVAHNVAGLPGDSTDSAGAYEIDGAPAGVYRLTVQARSLGYLCMPEDAVSIEIEAGHAYTDIDFALSPAGSVEGTVTNRRAEPVQGAVLRVYPANLIQHVMKGMESADTEIFESPMGNTDELGAFLMRGLSHDTEYRVGVKAAGYAWAASEPFQTREDAPTARADVVLEEGCRVAGLVRGPDGGPLPEAFVSLVPESFARDAGWMGPPENAKADSDGRFAFPNTGAGRYRLIAGMRSRRRGRMATELQLDVDGVTDIENIELIIEEPRRPEGTGQITGTVVADSGQPVPEVPVRARPGLMAGRQFRATTGPDGAFAFTTLDGSSYALEVVCDAGRARLEGVAVGSNVTLRLAPPILVSGTVVTAAGACVPACQVSLESLDDESDAAHTIRDLFRSVFDPEGGGAATDADGYFEFLNVEPGQYCVKAESPSEGAGASNPFTAAAGADVTGLVVVLEPGRRFSGTVVNARGEPVKGALVVLSPTGGNDMTSQFITQMLPTGLQKTAGSAVSGQDGTFTIPQVAPGAYQLAATHPDYARAVDSAVRIQPGRDTAGYRIVLPAAGKAKGRYVVGGVPQAGVAVMLIGPAGIQFATTDSAGHFEVTGLAPGSYLVNPLDVTQLMYRGDLDLQSIDIQPQVIDVAEGLTTDIDLGATQGVPVSGTLYAEHLDSLTMVLLRKPGGPDFQSISPENITQWIDAIRYLGGQTLVNPDGSFSLDNVAPGDYLLEVYSVDLGSGPPDIEALLNAGETPRLQQAVTVGDAPISLDIVLPAQ